MVKNLKKKLNFFLLSWLFIYLFNSNNIYFIDIIDYLISGFSPLKKDRLAI